jgi:hypothetical protein
MPILAFLLYRIIFRRRHQRALKSPAQMTGETLFWPGLDSEFYLLERRLGLRGLPRQPSETLSVWLTRALTIPALADLRMPLQDLLRLHYRHRFDPRGLSKEERNELVKEVKNCLSILSQIDRRAK